MAKDRARVRQGKIHQCPQSYKSRDGASKASDYYFNLINENDCDQRKLFKTASALLGGSSQKQYPKHSDPAMLANDFGRFFTQKIDDIRSKLDRIDPSSNQPDYSTRGSVQEDSYTGTPFTNFEPISSERIKKLVLNAPNKTCDNGPIPTKIVKDCINELLPTISKWLIFRSVVVIFLTLGKRV